MISGYVKLDGWGDGVPLRVLIVTPEQAAQFKSFVDSQVDTEGPYNLLFNFARIGVL